MSMHAKKTTAHKKTKKNHRTRARKLQGGLLEEEGEEDNSRPKVFEQEDFVFCKDSNGKMTSCGYKIQSSLLDTHHKNMMGGSHHSKEEGIHEFFQKKVVPMGLAYAPPDDDNDDNRDNRDNDTHMDDNPHDDHIGGRVVDDDLYEKLLDLANDAPRKFKTNTTRKRHNKIT